MSENVINQQENKLKGNIIATVTDIDTAAEGESVILQVQDVCDSTIILDITQPDYVLYVTATVNSVCEGYTPISPYGGVLISYTIYLGISDIDVLCNTFLVHNSDGVDSPIIDIQHDNVTGSTKTAEGRKWTKIIYNNRICWVCADYVR